MSNDPFNSSGDDPSPFNPSEVLIDPNKDYYSELVGEDKKFKTPADLARAKVHSDLFIKKLQDEAATLRNELTKAQTVEDLLTRLDGRGTPAPATPPAQPQPNGNPSVNSPVDFEELKNKLKNELLQEELNKKREANLNEVKTKLVETLGSEAPKFINSKAAELGITPQELQELATKSPALFYQATGFGAVAPKSPDPFFSAPAPRVNTSGLVNNAPVERGAKYYDNLLKTDKKKWLTKEVQLQMHKDALRLGERFFDN